MPEINSWKIAFKNPVHNSNMKYNWELQEYILTYENW